MLVMGILSLYLNHTKSMIVQQTKNTNVYNLPLHQIMCITTTEVHISHVKVLQNFTLYLKLRLVSNIQKWPFGDHITEDCFSKIHSHTSKQHFGLAYCALSCLFCNALLVTELFTNQHIYKNITKFYLQSKIFHTCTLRISEANCKLVWERTCEPMCYQGIAK